MSILKTSLIKIVHLSVGDHHVSFNVTKGQNPDNP